jgi:hypothetical protein
VFGPIVDVASVLHADTPGFPVDIRITRPWWIDGFPLARLEAGQVFCVRASIAIYLFAMHCAEPVRSGLAHGTPSLDDAC